MGQGGDVSRARGSQDTSDAQKRQQLLADPPQCIPCIGAAPYEEVLYVLRDELPEPWNTFYAVESDPALAQRHTFLRAPRFYTASTGGRSLAAWVMELIDGTAQDRGSRAVN
jgi:hypothetical protein